MVNEAQIIIGKVDPKFLKTIQEMKTNGTIENVSLIIWLYKDLAVRNMSMENLKIYAASTFANNFNANVFYIGKALPVIMAEVSANYIDNVASYEFVEHVDNGNGRIYPALDVSKNVIRADSCLMTL
jgi:hypothetical protein